MSNELVPLKNDESKGELNQLVSFSLGDEEFGIEVLKVREIIRMTAITHMPNTPHYIEGIINLRGRVIPIISMRRKFGLAETENNNQTRIIVVDVDGDLTGFIVDAVSEVIRISDGEIQPPPPVVSGGMDQECITGVINRADRLLVLLSLDKMFSREETQLFAGM